MVSIKLLFSCAGNMFACLLFVILLNQCKSANVDLNKLAKLVTISSGSRNGLFDKTLSESSVVYDLREPYERSTQGRFESIPKFVPISARQRVFNYRNSKLSRDFEKPNRQPVYSRSEIIPEENNLPITQEVRKVVAVSNLNRIENATKLNASESFDKSWNPLVRSSDAISSHQNKQSVNKYLIDYEPQLLLPVDWNLESPTDLQKSDFGYRSFLDDDDEPDGEDEYVGEKNEDSLDDEESLKKNKNKVNRKYHKYMLPLLLAYKLKFFTLIPLMMGGLVLLAGSTGMAGFFFALFAAVMGLKLGGK